MAIRHPERVSALALLVPLADRPPTEAASAKPMPAWVEALMMQMIGSDFLFWAATQVARAQVIKLVLATPWPRSSSCLLRRSGGNGRTP